MSITVAVDIGGTFTDLVVYHPSTGEVKFSKSPTTHEDLSKGILDCLNKAGVSPAKCSYFKHGTTVVINALLERKGARTALVTTAGFRDLAEMGRGNRSEPFNLFFHRELPLVERPHRFELRERLNAKGECITPIEPNDLASVLEKLEQENIESVAVCFLHSYRNPVHEQQAGNYFRENSKLFVSLSNELSREWREYERTSTTLANAFVGPLVNRYINNLQVSLQGMGFTGQLLLMESNGGVMSAETGRDKPIYLVESGPVAGCVGAQEIGRLIHEENVIAFDMGGTTVKCALVQKGNLSVESVYWVGGYGKGIPIQAPVVDIIEVGVGGGSIAWLDPYGSLQIGPKSAGSQPGPVAFGRGGRDVTIVDAHVAVGHLAPHHFLGGEMPLDRDLALTAISEQIASPLNQDTYHIADGILQIANMLMSNAVRKMSLEKGVDPRSSTMVAYGGTGPLHATSLARELSIPRVIIPQAPAHFSALGMLLANIRHDYKHTLVSPLDSLDSGSVEDAFIELIDEAEEQIRTTVPESGDIKFLRFMELRYKGQEHTLNIQLSDGGHENFNPAVVRNHFDVAYEDRYGRSEPNSPVEVLGIQLVAEGTIAKPDITGIAGSDSGKRADVQQHRVYDRESRSFTDWAYIERETLQSGDMVEGPAIIYEHASTTVLQAGDRAIVTYFGALDISVGGV